MAKASSYTTGILNPTDKFLVTDVNGGTQNILTTQIEDYILGVQGDRKIPVEAQIDFTTVEPPLIDGTRYINSATGISSVNSISVISDYIYEVRGNNWYEIIPAEGWMVWNKTLKDTFVFNGVKWISISSPSANLAYNNVDNNFSIDQTATGFKTPAGTAAGFLKADGSVDTSVYSPLVHYHSFPSLTSIPTTILGYGLTVDYNSLGDARWLGINNKAVDSNLLNGIDSLSFARVDAVSIYNKQQVFTPTTLTVGANVSWDLNTSQKAIIILTQNVIINAPTNMIDGGSYNLRVTQDATGSRLITWNAVFNFGAVGVPILSTTANKSDFLGFESDGTTMYFIGIRKGY